jgi:hypothetical protein
MTAVHPSLSIASTLAPALNNMETHSGFPPSAAAIVRVRPLASFLLMSPIVLMPACVDHTVMMLVLIVFRMWVRACGVGWVGFFFGVAAPLRRLCLAAAEGKRACTRPSADGAIDLTRQNWRQWLSRMVISVMWHVLAGISLPASSYRT